MHYVVDSLNRVIDVDAEWEAAAAGTEGGDTAMRAQVIGRALESFMIGDATRMFMRSALDAARLLGETRVLPYRCDSPDAQRRFEMVISPLGDGHVQVAHRLVSQEPRQARKVRRPALLPAPLAGWHCTQCNAVRRPGHKAWLEEELTGPDRLALIQDVCPTCTQRLFEPATGAGEQNHA